MVKHPEEEIETQADEHGTEEPNMEAPVDGRSVTETRPTDDPDETPEVPKDDKDEVGDEAVAEDDEDLDDDEEDEDDDWDDEDEEDEDDKDEDDDDEAGEDDEEVLDFESYQVKLKPQLDPETRTALALRRVRTGKRPHFRRQEWHRYKRLGLKWRKPKGIHSKQRRGLRYREPTAKVGYGAPSLVSGLHPSGFQEVLVHTPSELEALDIKTQAARIGGTVGLKKREAIHARAEELKVRVLNPTRRRRALRKADIPDAGGEQQ